MADEPLFKNYKYCEICRRPLSLSFKDDVCPQCKDTQLFHEVKEYIRANIVNEYQVSEHFNLPHSKVKEWIREGRIEYVEDGHVVMAALHCEGCGTPITFGTLCPRCLKKKNMPTGKYYGSKSTSKMHFLDSEHKTVSSD